MNALVADGDGVQFDTRRFHLRMAVVFVLIAFGGFTPSYFAPVLSGTFHMPPIAHIHGILLFSWALFYLAQTAWVALTDPVPAGATILGGGLGGRSELLADGEASAGQSPDWVERRTGHYRAYWQQLGAAPITRSAGDQRHAPLIRMPQI